VPAGLMGWGLSPTLVQIQVWKGIFQVDWPTGHAMRLNSQTGTESSPVSSLNCDRPLCSRIGAPETVMSTGVQITDSVRPYAPRRLVGYCSIRACYDPAGWADGL